MNRKLLTEHGQKTIAFSERPGVDFCLSAKEVGRGASCVVYHAVSSDQTEHLLKEYYPKHLDLSRDSSGQIIVPADQADAFEDGLQRFRAGCEQQKTIRLSNEGLKNFTCNVQGYYHGNGTEYIDMTCFNGQTYDHVQEESAHNLMRRMRTLAYVVGNYHKSGLLHLDIKPENIYVRPKGETVEDVMLFDFDSVTPISELRTPKALSCTKTWAAPEQLLPNRRDRICEATDIFAIGEILFYKLMGRHSESRERRSFSTFTFDDSNPLFKNVNPQLFPLLEEILKHTICNVVENRYQSTTELLEKLEQAIVLSNPHEPFLHHHLPSKSAFFIGRDAVLEEIEDRLNHTDKLFVSSIGGMGKSELAKQYAHAHKDDYDAVIFCVWSTDLESMILDDLPIGNLQQNDDKIKEYAARKYRVLSELCSKQRVLIIVDNFNDLQDKALAKLLRLNCKILFTTRHDVTEYNYEQLRLGTLDEEYVWALFRKWYKRELTAEDHAAVQQIFDLYQNHTMAVELIAKQMQASNVTPKEMLGRLNAGGFSDSGRERVIHAKDGTNSKMNIHDHIRRLFDVSDLSEEQVYILANLALIPPTGISRKQFHDWCNLDTYEDITDLAESGWLQQNEEKDLISLHPVVAGIMLDDITDIISSCSSLLSSFAHYIRGSSFSEVNAEGRYHLSTIAVHMCGKITQYGISHKTITDFVCACAYTFGGYDHVNLFVVLLKQMLEMYESATQDCKSEKANICFVLGCLYSDLSDYISAKKMRMSALDMYLQLYGKKHKYTADAYNDLGVSYYDLDKLEEAEECYLKALDIWQSLYGEISSDVADAYNNLGLLYAKLDNHEKAEHFYLKAISIKHQLFGESHIDNSTTYDNIACLYDDQGLHANAEEYHKRALSIRISILGENHHSTATSFNNLGSLYSHMGLYKKAEEFYLKALGIMRSIYGDNHSLVAATYCNLGLMYEDAENYEKAKAFLEKTVIIEISIYGSQCCQVADTYGILGSMYHDLQDYSKAERCYLSALDIRQAILPKMHEDTAFTCNKLGMLYRDWDKLSEAEEYYDQALQIKLAVFGKEDPRTAIAYKRLGFVYHDLQDFAKAEQCYLSALQIQQAVLPEMHEDTAFTFEDLGILYHDWGKPSKAEEYYDQALQIKLAIFGKEDPETAIAYKRLGFVYHDLQDFAKAEQCYLSALQIQQAVLPEMHEDTASTCNNLGILYHDWGKLSKAEEYYDQALKIKLAIFGKEDPETAIAYKRLGFVYHDLQDFAKAEQCYLSALQIQQAVLPEMHEDTAFTCNKLGMLYRDWDKLSKAEEYYDQALQIKLAVFGKKDPRTAIAYKRLGFAYHDLQDFAKAEQCYLSALQIQQAVLPEMHEDTAFTFEDLGILYHDWGKLSEAEEYYDQALQIKLAIFGKEDPETAIAYKRLGSLYHDLQEFARAEQCYLSALQIQQAVLPEMHEDTAFTCNKLGMLYRDWDKLSKAEEYYDQALQIKLAVFGKEDPETAIAYKRLGFAYHDLQDFAKAEQCYLSALKIQQAVFPKMHEDTAFTFEDLGILYHDWGKLSEAEEYYDQALQIILAVFGKNDPRTAISYKNLGVVSRQKKQYSKAIAELKEALRIFELVYGLNCLSVDAGSVYSALGKTYAEIGDTRMAEEHYRKSLEIRLALMSEDHPSVQLVLRRIEELNNN